MKLTALLGLFLSLGAAADDPSNLEPFRRWSLAKAVEVLNSSPWARHETFTRVVGGVGSGVAGEKEIYNRFYVRFLSARPIREAYARIQQIQNGYDRMSPEEQGRFDRMLTPSLDMDAGDWIVVSVTFRSNDPNEESTVRRFFQSETAPTLKNKAFLSTPAFSQVEVAAYFPPREESVGAKFVFPRVINGAPVVAADTDRIAFELLEVPGAHPRLRAIFSVRPMVLDGKVVF
jgi:hypothetical protein